MLDTGNRFLAAAQRLQAHGFRIFPLAPGTKDRPTVKEFADVASADGEKARAWWTCPVFGELAYNIAISCRNLADGSKLIGVDVDNKADRRGDEDILALELQGKFLPETFEQATPSGGRHLIYKTNAQIGNLVEMEIAPGLDIRGAGGYLAAAGSEIDGKAYTAVFRPIADAPQWLIDACAVTAKSPAGAARSDISAGVDQVYARNRAEAFAKSLPPAPDGTRNGAAYEHTCQLRDLGVDAWTVYELLAEHWAPRCDPPFDEDELIITVDNGYKYSRDERGNAAPENAFDEVPPAAKPEETAAPLVGPVETLNREHAFVISGGGHHILWETKDEKGVEMIVHLKEETFHRKYAARTMVIEKKVQPITKVWMTSPNRRAYDGFCFRPGLEVSPKYYNFWRGFTVQPTAVGEVLPAKCVDAVDAFFEHTLENVCLGDAELARWLIGYFAHMVQRPWEKPQCCLVFKGLKGVGKSALIERMGGLFGRHFWSVAEPRYLVGNFNSHLEQCIIFVLEEAFWSGDKSVDGILKNLVTGAHHTIEHKGQEAYRVDNCTRIVIMGNEEWLVPATGDERRYAVFQVGDERRRDKEFFVGMKEGLEAGGYRLLLRRLLDFDLSTVDVDRAPATEGLFEQKIHTMGLQEKWWFECLSEMRVLASDEEWPKELHKDSLRDAFVKYARSRNARMLLPDSRSFGRCMLAMCSGIKEGRATDDGKRVYTYRLPPLDEARQHFCKLMEHEIKW